MAKTPTYSPDFPGETRCSAGGLNKEINVGKSLTGRSPNDARLWRRGKDRQFETKTLSRRPEHVPGYASRCLRVIKTHMSP